MLNYPYQNLIIIFLTQTLILGHCNWTNYRMINSPNTRQSDFHRSNEIIVLTPTVFYESIWVMLYRIRFSGPRRYSYRGLNGDSYYFWNQYTLRNIYNPAQQLVRQFRFLEGQWILLNELSPLCWKDGRYHLSPALISGKGNHFTY